MTVQSVNTLPRTVTGCPPVAHLACGVRVTVQAVIGASTSGHMILLLPATQVHQSPGDQEVMPAPPSDVQPIGRQFAPGWGANRMVLAGAGLPKSAPGPGRLFLLPR
jgi:hypothetical protein